MAHTLKAVQLEISTTLLACMPHGTEIDLVLYPDIDSPVDCYRADSIVMLPCAMEGRNVSVILTREWIEDESFINRVTLAHLELIALKIEGAPSS